MTSTGSPRHDVPSGDELDDILNGIDNEELFDMSNIQPQLPPQQARGTKADADIGIDEEIKVVKKRKPVPKLDEERLLSAAGIPRLRRISKERLRFKGKGHEYGDIARMLNMYQLWLDDLYPRAKFADALVMVEALGHKKRMHMMRKDWIDEAKPRGRIDTDEEREIPEVTAARADPSTEQMHDIQSGTPEDGSAAGRQAEPGESAAMPNETSHIPDDDGNPDEDDLDALLAESAGFDIPPSSAPNKLATQDEDPFADDMEAMAEMEDMW